MTRIQPTGQPIVCTAAETPGAVAYRQERTPNSDVKAAADLRASVRVACTRAGVLVRAVTSERFGDEWKLMVFASCADASAVEDILLAEPWELHSIFQETDWAHDAAVITVYVKG